MATSTLQDDADFVIIGSGAGGATAARWLASGGASVLLVEEGPAPQDNGPDGLDAATRLYRNSGAMISTGGDAIGLLMGRCVGGSTAVGYGTFSPLPEEVWQQWSEQNPRWQQRLPFAELESAREVVETEWHVSRTNRDLFGTAGQAMMRSLPGRSDATWRSTVGCEGAGQCTTGCPNRAMQSADRTMIVRAKQHGARLHIGCRVDRIVIHNGVATGVVGQGQHGPFAFQARKAIFLCAGAIYSTWLLLRSGLPARGLGLQLHASATIAARMREPCQLPVAGAAVHSHALRSERTELSAVVVPERLRAALLPGVGLALESRLANLDMVATWTATVRVESRGQVRKGWGRPRVHYPLATADRQCILRAVSRASEALLRAGASEVFAHVHGAPEVIVNAQQCAGIAQVTAQPAVVPLQSAHFFGGLDVDDRFQVPGVRGLVLADAAVLPGSTGVGPLGTVAAVATAITQRWI